MRISPRSTIPLFLSSVLVLAGCGEPAEREEAGGEERQRAPQDETASIPAPTETPASAPVGGPAPEITAAMELPAPGEPGWADAQLRYLERFAGSEGVQSTESGVHYAVLRPGAGVQPEPGQTVRVHYEGRLVTGEVFDSSYARGAPAEFATTRVIQGWQDVLPLMREGAVWQMAIPAELAYGSRAVGGGRIPARSALVFTIELLEVTG